MTPHLSRFWHAPKGLPADSPCLQLVSQAARRLASARPLRLGLPIMALALGTLVAGCAPQAAGSPSAATLAVWMTPTPSATSTALPIALTTATPPPPTPTPFTYTVRESDTLIGIAFRFGVTLDALRAANPLVDERFLSIGQTLVIPLARSSAPEAAAATPYPLQVDAPRCFLQLGGSAWCVSGVHNPGQAPVTSILVEFTVSDAQGNALLSSQVSPPLERLPAGATMPVAVLVGSGLTHAPHAEVRLVRAAAIADQGQNALPVEILEASPQPLEGGIQVSVRARLSPEASAPAAGMRALLVLYNSRDQIVGWRVLDLKEAWAIGEIHELRLRAYSLGEPIARHEVILEPHD
jgi:LysM repeat protein